jgi:TldD protein
MIYINIDTLRKVLSIPTSKGIEFAEIFAEKTTSNSLTLEENKIEKVRSGIDLGVGLRLIHENISYYGYVNSFEEKDLLGLAKELSSSVKTGKKPLALKRFADPLVYQHSIELYSKTDQKAKLLFEANQAARNYDPRIIQVSASFAESKQEILIANSVGLFTKEDRVRTRFVTQVIATENNTIETGYEAVAGTQGIEILANNKHKEIALTAAKRAILCLEAPLAPAGQKTVVLSGEAGGTMVHEACGHALEADFIHKKTSIFTAKVNKKVVAELITVIDDGTMPNHYGTNCIDDEGTPTKKNFLITEGVLTGFMTDRQNAKRLNIPLSGNGRRQSYRHTPIPRMTNTYIAPGKDTYANIVSSVKDGVLVKKMGGGQVDITNGNFVFEISEGYLLKNGKQAEPIRGATLVGNGIEVLASVDMVGNDLHFIPGTCGKGQSAPVTDGQPTLRIPKITIGGHQ